MGRSLGQAVRADKGAGSHFDDEQGDQECGKHDKEPTP
jgi:hypothetical protein